MKKRKKLKVIKSIVKTPCYECSEIGGIPTKRSKCKVCRGTGFYKEYHYIHILNNKYAYDGDTLK